MVVVINKYVFKEDSKGLDNILGTGEHYARVLSHGLHLPCRNVLVEILPLARTRGRSRSNANLVSLSHRFHLNAKQVVHGDPKLTFASRKIRTPGVWIENY